MQQIAVAIDGPSGAGKSTIARAAAKKLGFVYVDTGALYRTIGLAACRAGIAQTDGEGIQALLPQLQLELCYVDGTQRVLLCGEDVSDAIRTPEAATYASYVSTIAGVRAYLLQLQRDMAQMHPVIMDGRDIGTVILPNAAVKIFLTASAQERAKRRYTELIDKGQQVTLEQVLADMQQRDEKDITRTQSPLKQAADAILLDTSACTLEESIQMVCNIVEKALQKHITQG